MSQTDKEITDGEKRFVESLVGSTDEVLLMKWVSKKKKNKVQQRLLVIGKYRLWSIKRAIGGKKQVRRTGHYYNLEKLVSQDPSNLILKFKGFELEISGEVVDEVLNIIRNSIQKITYGFPEDKIPVFEVNPPNRLEPLKPIGNSLYTLLHILLKSTKEITDSTNKDIGAVEGLEELYKAYCSFYETEINTAFIQFIRDLSSSSSRELLLEQCSGIELTSEYALNLLPIVAALRYDTWFTKVSLKDVQRKDAVQVFSDTMRYNTTIEKLYLSNVDASEGFVELGEALKHNTKNSLSFIDLSKNQMKDKGIIGLAAGLETFTHGLKSLNVSNCGIQSKGISALMKAFESNSTLGRSITQLNISNNPLNNGSIDISNWISSMREGNKSSLTTLCAANCGLDAFILMQSIRNSLLETLEVLDISSNKLDKIATTGVTFLLEHTSSLSYLDISNCHLSPDSSFVILSSIAANAKISKFEIDISDNALGDEGASSISKVIPTASNIITLKIRNNHFSKEGMSLIIRSCAENKSLITLDLSFNFKSNQKNGDVMKSLADMMTRHPTLETLILAGNDRNYIGKDLGIVFPAISNTKKLSALDIKGNRIGDKMAVSLAEALSKNTSLTFLSWDENDVNLGGYQAFASCLKSNKTLKTVPTPVEDLDSAINEAKDKKRFRDKLTLVVNNIQTALAINRGEPPGPAFDIPTLPPREWRMSMAPNAPNRNRTRTTEEVPINMRTSMSSPASSSPLPSPRDSGISLPPPVDSSLTLPPPPPQLEDEEDLPPPPTPPPF